MWRTISRPASALAIVAALVLSGCGEGDKETSAGAQAASPSTTVTPTSPTTAAAPATTAPTCTNVTFSSNPDDRASDIKATGLSCAEAEALVRTVGPQLKGDGGPSRVEADGFVCARLSARAGDHGPPSAFFECASGTKKVTFIRT
jgi:hypothetical protein